MKVKIKGGNKTAFYNSKLIKVMRPAVKMTPIDTFGQFKDLRSL